MRRATYRVVMAAAMIVAACQDQCDEACLSGDSEVCGGVEGLRLVLEPVSGDGQRAPVGTELGERAVVRLLTAFLRTPVEDAEVVFRITGGGGRFENGPGTGQTVTVETDDQGHAETPSWKLGPTPGSNTITAEVDGVPLGASVSGTPLTMTATATAATNIVVLAGNDQTAAAGGFVPVDPEIVVRDAFGAPVANIPLTWSVTGGGGSLAGSPLDTDTQGRAKTRWQLGTAAGPNRFTVTATGPGFTGSPVTITATGVAGPAHTLSLHAGNTQTARIGTALPILPAVRLMDANGNSVAGATVTFSVTQGGGAVQGSTAATDANGVATVAAWILGAAPGPNGLRALATGIGIIGNPVDFVATGTVQSAVAVFVGNGQTSPAGLPVPVRPAVRVTGTDGGPIVGIGVSFQVDAGPDIVSGSVTGGTPVTDQNGVATVGSWTLANQVGSNRLIATVGAPAGALAGNPVTFTATGIAGTPVIMAKVAGDNQSAPTGFSPEVLPTVRIGDFFNNPVAGVTVTFAVTGGGGVVTGGTVVTDALGRARVGNWQMGPTPGTNTLSATANVTTITGNPTFFNATGFMAGVRAARP